MKCAGVTDETLATQLSGHPSDSVVAPSTSMHRARICGSACNTDEAAGPTVRIQRRSRHCVT